KLLGATSRQSETGHDLVEDEDDAVPGAELANPLEIAVARRYASHISNDRLQDNSCNLIGVVVDQGLHRVQVVEWRDERIPRRAFRHARAIGYAEGKGAASRRDEKRISMTMIAPLHLDNLFTPRESPG